MVYLLCNSCDIDDAGCAWYVINLTVVSRAYLLCNSYDIDEVGRACYVILSTVVRQGVLAM